MINVVLFDADGVVILPNHFADYLEHELDITREMTEEFFARDFRDCLVGRADLKDMIEPFLSKWGWKGSVEEFLNLWFTVENAVDTRMLRAVQTLRDDGIICGLATNQESYRVDYMKSEMGLAKTFDVILSSAEIGALKSERTYFERTTARLGVQPFEVLFWDDALSNVQMARRYGWHAELFRSFEQFEQILQQYLPSFPINGHSEGHG